VIYLYFGFLPKKPMSLAEIAKFTGRGKETVRRIKIRAIDKLKENPEVRELFKDFI
ncbi:MAG: RNA polymerase subunit sigma, partial [Candidatus Marinimicrobia bacterium]|nr:RNA polymerase subunit sigma [Candidatus Neomarinimicrobiota bacterium]